MDTLGFGLQLGQGAAHIPNGYGDDAVTVTRYSISVTPTCGRGTRWWTSVPTAGSSRWRHRFADARIVSFEPLSGPAALWRAVFAGDARATLVEAAVGPEAGEAEIHVSARDDSSSLLPISARQSALFPGTAEAGTATIRVQRLADALPAADIAAPALLKLDVQGFELQALAGCEDVLERFDWVYAECSFQELYTGQSFADEVIAWLRERGLRLAGVYHMAYDERGRAVQADFLFGR